MMRLARCSTQPMREHCWPSPLPQPLSEPVRLFSGCEPEELPKDPAEELPKELWMVESQKLEEKAKEVEEADAGAAVARACGVMYEQVNRRFWSASHDTCPSSLSSATPLLSELLDFCSTV